MIGYDKPVEKPPQDHYLGRNLSLNPSDSWRLSVRLVQVRLRVFAGR